MKNQKLILRVISATILVAIFATATVMANPFLKLVGPNWRLLERTQLPNNYWNFMTRHPETTDEGMEFEFLKAEDDDYTNYLITNYNKDLTEKTITATIRVTGEPIKFGYNKCGSNPSGTEGGFVRIEFQRTSAGGWVETDYWWSHAASVDLMYALDKQVTLIADTSDLSDWSDIYGHYASDPLYTEAFYDALKDVKEISFSFGGGSCFANGVNVDGSATFEILELSID